MSKILIVEDEIIIRTALRKLLTRNKYDVKEAASVKEATGKYNLDSFNLIISDLRLPAVDSMRMGAVDYIAKPFDHDEMLTAVKRVLVKAEKSAMHANANTPSSAVDGMIGNSPQMKALYQMIYKVAPTNATVLVSGETGTGKELVARALHYQSPRADKPFICVNCAAIPETLIARVSWLQPMAARFFWMKLASFP